MFPGIPGPFLWGIIMMITSIIPMVGCSIIWGPAGIIMLLTGHIWEGMAILQRKSLTLVA